MYSILRNLIPLQLQSVQNFRVWLFIFNALANVCTSKENPASVRTKRRVIILI